MANDPRFTRIATSLPSNVPFVGPEAQERQTGRLFQARLGANESIFGPSPNAIAAMQEASQDIWKYGDPENHDLREAIAAHHRVPPDHVMIGEGIDGLLGLACRLFVEPDEAVITSNGAYPTFNFQVAGVGGVLHLVPFVNDCEDPETLLAAARKKQAKLLYFSNPNNPMGTMASPAAVAEMISQVPPHCILILDEAYAEFAPIEQVPVIDPSDPRVLRFRTFSKAYGMAGARVGYVIGAPELISAFDKLRNHYGMCRTSQIGAIAAIEDQTWLEDVVRKTERARAKIADIARQNGLAPLPSVTNFVAIDCSQDGAYSDRILRKLLQLGIFVRKPFAAPQDRCIRISCGPDDQLELFAKALRHVMQELG